jgi:hypothetical protein
MFPTLKKGVVIMLCQTVLGVLSSNIEENVARVIVIVQKY